MPREIKRRIDRLEAATTPPGTCMVKGVAMDVPQMISFFRQRAIAEQARDPAKAAQRRAEAIQRAEALRKLESTA